MFEPVDSDFFRLTFFPIHQTANASSLEHDRFDVHGDFFSSDDLTAGRHIVRGGSNVEGAEMLTRRGSK